MWIVLHRIGTVGIVGIVAYFSSSLLRKRASGDFDSSNLLQSVPHRSTPYLHSLLVGFHELMSDVRHITHILSYNKILNIDIINIYLF